MSTETINIYRYMYDRAGKLMEVHNKNVLYDPEEEYGISIYLWLI